MDLFGESTLPAGFDLFWQAYPRHEGKQEALKAWRRLHFTPVQSEHVLRVLEANKHRPDWRENLRLGRMEFIPRASTWLNNRRFEDETLQLEAKAAVLWFEECAELHQGACASQWQHHLQKAKDGLHGKRMR
jgi:hypothetical protein